MSRIKGSNTKPEIAVRKLLHSMGFRFRLHDKTLPGKPDIVLRRHKRIIFVHGCFWHGHEVCTRSKRPSTNSQFWDDKISKNVLRDHQVATSLKQLGWQVLVIWQCEMRDKSGLARKIDGFMRSEER
ncbi:very short patch repair endonuclease [Geomonas silvestris]|uniref:very short patch repair endonuclease n=1 Tax=Geomonas silvestris TaxID=2740184 RepID=UPI001FE6645E|nr:very short patch repair endonuclease [Geomonas silvestris]